jgi:hypothetical protein
MAHIKNNNIMHIFKNIGFSLLILLVSEINAQGIEHNYRKLKYASEYHLLLSDDTIAPFYISANPITNREYLTYLCWTADVYRDYPEKLLNAFPNLNKNHIDSLFNKGFTTIQIRTLVESNYFVENYLFSLKYLDFPVVGLNWGQSMNFLNWLSDRYNEYILIHKGIQELYLNQYCNNCFTTEAYLMDQYEGMINRPIWDPETNQIRSVKWKDKIFVPSFRLPSNNEIAIAGQKINRSLKEYKPNKFLLPWIKHYIEINKDQIMLRIETDNFLSFSYNKNVIMRPEYHETFGKISETTLDQLLDIKENSIFKIFSDLNQNVVEINNYNSTVEKDSLGRMPFIIISEDKNSNPIFIERINNSSDNNDNRNPDKKHSIFRYALCGIKK